MTITLPTPIRIRHGKRWFRFARGTRVELWGLYGRVLPAGPYLRLTWTYPVGALSASVLDVRYATRNTETTMKLTITIDMDNAAFADYPGPEIVRILRRLAQEYCDWGIDGTWGSRNRALRDINGNTVGFARIK